MMTNHIPITRSLFIVFALFLIISCEVMSTNKEGTFSSFDGTKIYYKDLGNGRPIVLLHGFISNGSSWYETEIVKTLIAHKYQVIIPDMRGNGKSDQPKEADFYKDNAEVKDIIALADHLKLETYEAIGYSRGSIILAELLTQDERITKAVIGGMGLDFSNPDWDRRKIFADAFSGRAPLNEMTEGAVKYAKSINADLEILGLLQDYQPSTSPEHLKTIDIPILVIAGNEDTDNGNPKDLQEALGNATLKIVLGDHNTTYRKEAFAKEVLEFIIK